jgi:hypothetical protein
MYEILNNIEIETWLTLADRIPVGFANIFSHSGLSYFSEIGVRTVFLRICKLGSKAVLY